MVCPRSHFFIRLECGGVDIITTEFELNKTCETFSYGVYFYCENVVHILPKIQILN